MRPYGRVRYWVCIILGIYSVFRLLRFAQSTRGRARANSANFFIHVHIAKTAGSTLNRLLARTHHAVCGIKGYSFTQPWNDGDDTRQDPRYPGWRRDRVHPDRMEDWGFHNCALLSHEVSMRNLTAVLRRPIFQGISKVALVPCREPVDHFLSMCNFQGLNVTQISLEVSCEDLIKKCVFATERFELDLLNAFDEVIVFRYNEVQRMVDFLGNYLPRRAIELPKGLQYVTNTPRKQENEHFHECSRKEIAKNLRSMWSYYNFCDKLKGNWMERIPLRGSRAALSVGT